MTFKILHALTFEMQQTQEKMPMLSEVKIVCCDMLGAALTNDSSCNTLTHLSPAFDGAPTLVSGPKAEAAGAAVRIGGVKVEGAFLTDITPHTSNVPLQIWRK